MHLSADEAALFYKLNAALLLDLNRHLHILPTIQTHQAFIDAPFADKVKLRDALYDHPELIDQFVTENPQRLLPEELAEVASWKHFVRGDFYILRFLKRHAILLDSGSPPKAYGVVGITEEIENLIPAAALPARVETVLLPFRGRIIYDGVIRTSSVIFGPGIQRGLNETYRVARESRGVLERLDLRDDTERVRPRQRRAPQPPLLPSAERIAREVESLKGADTAAERRALAVLRAAAHLLCEIADDAEDWDQAVKDIRRTRTALTHLEREVERQIWGD